MPTSIQLLRMAAVAACVLVATPAAGFAALPAAAATTSGDSTRVAAGISPEAQAHRDSANAFWQAGELRRAQGEFLIAARLMREAGVLPATEMQNAASIAFGRDRAMDAAWMLDVLAADALAFGRPDVQAQALLDAATLYARLGQGELARQRLATLRPLLSSPFVPDSVRARAAEGGVADRR
jgi:hypothetical protein